MPSARPQASTLWIAIALTVLTVTRSASADSKTPDLARQLIAETGVLTQVRDQMRQLIKQTQAQNPTLPGSTFEALERELVSPKLEADMVAVWTKHFTTAELKQILAFVRTPTGRKFYRTSGMLSSQLGAVAGLAGFRLHGVLQKLHPQQFPKDEQAERAMREAFEALQSGGGSRKGKP